MKEWQERYLKVIEGEPLIVYHAVSVDYLQLQLATPLDDRDDAILLYLIDEGNNEYSLSEQAWISTLLPYENDNLTDETILEEAEKAGFEASGLNLYRMVDERNLIQTIRDFDTLIKTLQSRH